MASIAASPGSSRTSSLPRHRRTRARRAPSATGVWRVSAAGLRRARVRDASGCPSTTGRSTAPNLWRELGARPPEPLRRGPVVPVRLVRRGARGNGALAGDRREPGARQRPEILAPRDCCSRRWPGVDPADAAARRQRRTAPQRATACGATGAGSSDPPVSASSTAAAHARPSAIAHTTSDAPRLASPQAYTSGRARAPLGVHHGGAAAIVAPHAERVEQFRHVGADEPGRQQDQVGRQLGPRAGHRPELALPVHPDDLDLLDDARREPPRRRRRERRRPHAPTLRGRPRRARAKCRGCSAPKARPDSPTRCAGPGVDCGPAR